MKILLSMILFFVPAMLSAPIIWNQNELQKLNNDYNQLIEYISNEARIDKLLKTIRIIESGDNYNARGKSGEKGAYQFSSGTWTSYSIMYAGRVLSMTKEKPGYGGQVQSMFPS